MLDDAGAGLAALPLRRFLGTGSTRLATWRGLGLPEGLPPAVACPRLFLEGENRVAWWRCLVTGCCRPLPLTLPVARAGVGGLPDGELEREGPASGEKASGFTGFAGGS